MSGNQVDGSGSVAQLRNTAKKLLQSAKNHAKAVDEVAVGSIQLQAVSKAAKSRTKVSLQKRLDSTTDN